jgi:hypothetical protein
MVCGVQVLKDLRPGWGDDQLQVALGMESDQYINLMNKVIHANDTDNLTFPEIAELLGRTNFTMEL